MIACRSWFVWTVCAACHDPEAGGLDSASAEVHPEVATILLVDWSFDGEVDSAWVEYRFEGDDWLATPADGDARSVPLLGLPPETDVSWRVHVESAGEVLVSDEQVTTTGALPDDLPAPYLESHDPALASPAGWMLVSVDTNTEHYYGGPFYAIIVDRQARVVWYTLAEGGRGCMYPRVSRDGTHVVIDENATYTFDIEGDVSTMRRLSLDLQRVEHIDAEGLIYSWDELDDGTVLRDDGIGWSNFRLVEVSPQGEQREVWSCDAWSKQVGVRPWDCYTNTVNHVPATDTVIWSMPSLNTVLEIDRQSGEIVHQFGELDGSWAIDPSTSGFLWQHYPNVTAEGTLMVSTHVPDQEDQQRAREFMLDPDTETLVEVWTYGEGVDEYAPYSGEATRLANGNTLINYGSGAAAREVTAAGEVAWDVAWPDSRVIGHSSLIDDLYALNRGP